MLINGIPGKTLVKLTMFIWTKINLTMNNFINFNLAYINIYNHYNLSNIVIKKLLYL